jgi:protein SCO1
VRSTAALLALLCALVGAACGDDTKSAADESGPAAVVETESTTAAPGEPDWAAPLVLDPAVKSPAFTLRDYTGKDVSLSDYRGKAVMLTFVYAQCPDVCQLIIQALARAQRKLGPDAGKMQIVAISIDPKGDTPENVERYLDARQLVGKARYLVGTRAELEPIWRKYGIRVAPGETNPAELAHTSFIYGIDAKGRQRVIYPADPLDPDAIASDVALLVDAA